MSVTNISTSLARLSQPTVRGNPSVVSDAELPQNASAVLGQYTDHVSGEGKREEDTSRDASQQERQRLNATSQSVGFPPVEYPTPGPELPAPLVPVREVPIEGNAAAPQPAPVGTAQNVAEKGAKGDLVERSEQAAPSVDEKDVDEASAVEDRADNALAELALHPAVQSKAGENAPVTKVDPAVAGSILEVEA